LPLAITHWLWSLTSAKITCFPRALAIMRIAGAASDADAEVEVVTALGGLGRLGRDVHRDFGGWMVLADPLHSRLQVGITGHDDDGIRAGVHGVVDEVDGYVDVGLFLFGRLVLQLARASGGATRYLAELILALDALEFGERGEGFEIGALPVALGREVAIGFDQGGEVFDSDDFFVWAESLKEALQIEPFPRRGGLQHAIVEVEAVHVNQAALFRRRGGCWWWGRVGHSSEKVCCFMPGTVAYIN
jgi:hypothetical protein